MNSQYYGAAAEYNKPKGSRFFNRKTVIMAAIFAVIAVLLIIALTIINAIASGPRNDVARLAARTSQFQGLIAANADNIKHPDLLKIAAEAELHLATNSLALTSAYGSKLPESISADEVDPAVAPKLADALKAGKHDEVFLEIMKEKTLLTLELAKRVQSQSSGNLTKTASTQTSDTMQLVADELNKIKI